MRPIEKGVSPIAGDYDDYRDAFPDLVSRLGSYCSYCERSIPTNLAVEHIQPKGLSQYEHLEFNWDNFVLGCVNCNSTKGKKDVILAHCCLPDRDNTFLAYSYNEAGEMEPAELLSATQHDQASAIWQITGLNKPSSEVEDANGNLVAIDRVSQRMQTWLIAEYSKEDLEASPSNALRRQIVRTALAEGYFSIWMKVFEDDFEMRLRFVEAFPGTASDCFDRTGAAISPRPENNLLDGGKI